MDRLIHDGVTLTQPVTGKSVEIFESVVSKVLDQAGVVVEMVCRPSMGPCQTASFRCRMGADLPPDGAFVFAWD